MIYFSNTEKVFAPDCICLEVLPKKENGETVTKDEIQYIIVSRHVYDQCVRLRVPYNRGVEELVSSLNMQMTPAVEYAFNALPEPINILAAYLAYVNPLVPPPTDLKMVCGYLHVMSSCIDFEAVTKVEFKFRNQISLPVTTFLSYESFYKEFGMTLYTIKEAQVNVVDLATLNGVQQPAAPAPTPTVEQPQQANTSNKGIPLVKGRDINAMSLDEIAAIGKEMSDEDYEAAYDAIGLELERLLNSYNEADAEDAAAKESERAPFKHEAKSEPKPEPKPEPAPEPAPDADALSIMNEYI